MRLSGYEPQTPGMMSANIAADGTSRSSSCDTWSGAVRDMVHPCGWVGATGPAGWAGRPGKYPRPAGPGNPDCPPAGKMLKGRRGRTSGGPVRLDRHLRQFRGPAGAVEHVLLEDVDPLLPRADHPGVRAGRHPPLHARRRSTRLPRTPSSGDRASRPTAAAWYSTHASGFRRRPRSVKKMHR